MQNVKIDAICKNNSKCEMFDTFREPNFVTFRDILSRIASIFTFRVDVSSHVTHFSPVKTYLYLRVTCGVFRMKRVKLSPYIVSMNKNPVYIF